MRILDTGDNAILRPIGDQGYSLFHDGILELARIEANGIRIDTAHLKNAIKENNNKVKRVRNKLMTHSIWKTWKRRFGDKSNINAPEQLGKILFEDLGFEATEFTDTGKYKADESVLESIDHPFVRKYSEFKKLQKAGQTFLKGIQNETDNGFLHPVFNLHIVDSFRSSSDSPNFQNLPVRNPKMSEAIRKCFIARKGHVFGEIDFGSLEVRIAACYNKDPKLLNYITDPTTDMHRDMAMQIFLLNESEVNKKNHRYSAKNKFVFAQFYGDYYIHCAKGLWEDITKLDMRGPDGEESLFKHLARKGIKKLGELDPKKDPAAGTFEKHMKAVEKDFWQKRFKVYNEWKNDWWKEYQQNGYFKLKSGFECIGVFDRKQVINYPVQGAAFHCLLWSLIKLNRWLRKYKMKTLIVGQIHDSIVLDIHESEIEDVLQAAKYIMTVMLPKFWKWIIVPLEIEAEISPSGKSWYEKEEYVIK